MIETNIEKPGAKPAAASRDDRVKLIISWENKIPQVVP
jgi:hypothetical protein